MPSSPEGQEFGFIDWVQQQNADPGSGIVLGIGDDAAVLSSAGGRQILVAKDVLMEGTHFTFPPATPQLAGRKSLAVNLSDLAAMGGTPTCAFVGLCLPRSRGREFAKQIHSGIQLLADEFQVPIAGGDTNIWDGPLVISITLLGEVEQGKALLRTGSQPGDMLFVTGPLGGSLPSGRHLTFTPRVALAQELSQLVDIHAMIDLSDGLARDLGHLLCPTGPGALLELHTIPIHSDVESTLSAESRLQHALNDGEDFELLFTVSTAEGQRLLQTPPAGTTLHHIGHITAESGIRLVDKYGRHSPLPVGGWEHRFAD